MNTNTAHINAQTSLLVSQLYVALFGRAPEVSGMTYWATQLDKGVKIEQIAQDMFNVVPSRAYYPAELDNAGIITKFYTQVLGRVPDQEGVAYWTKRLDTLSENGSVLEKSLAQGTVIVEILNAVVAYQGSDVVGLQSQSLLNNKVEVAQKFALEMGGTDIHSAAILLSKVQAGEQGKETALDYLKTVSNTAPSFDTKELNMLATEDIPLAGTLSTSDKDVGDTISFLLATAPKHGVVAIKQDGSYLYTPQRDFFGSDSFSVIASDSVGASASQTLNITVNPINDVPVANADTIYLEHPGTFPFPVLANDSDDGGNAITISSFTNPQYGRLELIDGKLIYSTPNVFSKVTDTFSYVIQDEFGERSTPATISVLIDPLPPFLLSPQAFVLRENSSGGRSVGFMAPAQSVGYNYGASWEIIGGNEKGNFTINRFTGEITVAANATFDAVKTNPYKLIVSTKLLAEDRQKPNVLNLMECSILLLIDNEFAPSILGESHFTISENTTMVSTFNVSDADRHSYVEEFRLSGADASKFTIDKAGTLQFIALPDFEKPRASDGSNTYHLTLIANDGYFDSPGKAIIITVTDLLGMPPKESNSNSMADFYNDSFVSVIGSISLESHYVLV